MPSESGRVEKLASLLESKNHLIRREAASALALISASNPQLWTVLRLHLYSHAWEARVAAAEALQLLLEIFIASEKDFCLNGLSIPDADGSLERLDLRRLVEFYKPLLSDAEAALTPSTERPSHREQRSQIDQHLEMNSTIGVTSRSFLADEEISSTQQRSSIVLPHSTTLKELTMDREDFSLKIDESDSLVEQFIVTTLVDLADRRWQTRHGAALAAAKVIATLKLERLGECCVRAAALRLLQVAALDRFTDFITGASSIAPVREAVAQALCILFTEVEAKCPELAGEVFSHLQALMSIPSRQLWHCRQTGLLLLKYYFSACSSASERLWPLLQTAIALTNDDTDEVISAAVVALSSLFENDRLSDAFKRPMIEKVMRSVWAIMDNEERHSQIREGVDSLLTDLLNVIGSWMRIDPSSSLSSRQFSIIACLIDPKFIERSQKAMRCISRALGRHIELGHEEIFTLVKRLYRFLLFSPIRDGCHQSVCHQTLAQLTSAVGEEFANVEAIQQTIGYWLACLVYDNKSVEIDVFAHRVDGNSSSVSSPTEAICGEEIHCMDEALRAEELIRKKLAASAFLAHVMDLLYASNLTIGDQPINLSIQLLLVPYLKSTSLHQRLGASLLVNSLSKCWRERVACGENSNWPYPALLAEALEEVVYKPLKIYDEVALAISSLTGDCNEFQLYCALKGAPREELIAVDKANSMEAVVERSYNGCLAKLTQTEERETLTARYNYVLHMIKSARMAIRTNAGRVAAICATSLLQLGRLSATITPLIKALMEAMEWEENCDLVEKVLCEAFPLLICATARRVPCPHSKLFKQLCTGIVSCEKFAPMPNKWPNTSFTIVSLNEDFNHSRKSQCFGVKSANCCRVMRAIFRRDFPLDECPELHPYLVIASSQELERNLLNMEVIRLRDECCGPSPADAPPADYVFSLMGHTNPAVRYRAARFLASCAAVNLPAFLNAYYHRMKDALGDLDADHHRCGAAELLMMLGDMGGALLGAVSLLAPLPLRAIGDPIEEVRAGAMQAFSRLVPYLSVEKEEKHALSGLDPSLANDYSQSFHFAHVLTKPGELPLVRREEVPGLRRDAELRDYQLEGITWMNYLWRFGLNGILADDMGLGKTLQTLCLLSMHQQEDSGHHPSLIVCPKTLVQWWSSEWSNYFPDKAPLVQLKNVDEIAAATLDGSNSIVVISYEQLRSQRALWKVRWAHVVLDEGHCIRNPASQVFDVVTRQLVAMHRLILSGTPVQNTPADLWSLFAFLMPGYLSTKSAFHAKYIRRIMACRSPKSSEAQIKEGEEALSQLHRQVLPFIMRRLKGDVLRELPDKVIVDYPCELSPLQRRLYRLIVDHCSLKAAVKPTKRDQFATIAQQTALSPLQTLISLRRLVDHPRLVEGIVTKIDPSRTNQQIDAGSFELSGKMVALKELLEECQIGGAICGGAPHMEGEEAVNTLATSSRHRALVFCQWKATVDLIASYIDAGVFGSEVSYLRLDGTISPNDRQSIADTFNADSSIDLLLLTTQIGGVGLTLTGADVVIFVDHDWNPTRDAQAIDRAHRLGQKRTVNVYRLITKDSIEEKVMNLQRFKTNTANALVGSDNRSLSTMNADELMEMFTLGDEVDGETQHREPSLKKRKQCTTAAPGTTTRGGAIPHDWSLSELWDSSGEYEQQYGIDVFKRLYAI